LFRDYWQNSDNRLYCILSTDILNRHLMQLKCIDYCWESRSFLTPEIINFNNQITCYKIIFQGQNIVPIKKKTIDLH
jgi:hypothetical protein